MANFYKNIREIAKELGFRVRAGVSVGFYKGTELSGDDSMLMLHRCDDQGVQFVRVIPNSSTGSVVMPTLSGDEVFENAGLVNSIINQSSATIEVLDGADVIMVIPPAAVIGLTSSPLNILSGLTIRAIAGTIGSVVGAVTVVHSEIASP